MQHRDWYYTFWMLKLRALRYSISRWQTCVSVAIVCEKLPCVAIVCHEAFHLGEIIRGGAGEGDRGGQSAGEVVTATSVSLAHPKTGVVPNNHNPSFQSLPNHFQSWFSTRRNLPTIHIDRLPADPVTLLRAQEHDRARHIPPRPRPPHRDIRLQTLLLLLTARRILSLVVPP